MGRPQTADAPLTAAEVLESIGDAFFALDRDWRFTYMNSAAERLLQRSRSDLLGGSIWEEFPAAVGSTFETEYRRAAADRVTVQFQAYYPPPLDCWYAVRAYPTSSGLAVYFQDDTDRRRAEADRRRQADRLREGEERYRTLFECMDEGYCVIEFLDGPHGPLSDYVHVQANPAFTANTGIPDIVGRTVRAVVPDEAEEWVGVYRTVVVTGQPVRFERELVATGRHLELAAFRIGPPERRQVAVLFKDITARKRAERELAEAHEFLHSSLDALSSHIAVLDEDGVILAVNDAWRRFADENQYTGHNYGVGANYLRACEPGGGDCVEGGMAAGLKDVLAGRLPLFEFEYPCHSPTEERWFVMRATRFKSPGPVRVVVAHEDVTGRKRAEDALKDADRRKDEFLATLAHELRNPLAPLRNGLQVLRLAGADGRIAADARTMMERQLSQMVHLVDDLLDISRISRGKIELRKERVELAGVVQQAVETSRPLIEQAGHALTVALPPGSLYVDGDVTRLAQVFSNLLNNAAKYTDRGGHIELAVRREGGEAVVSVKDDGVGIPAEMLRRVFDIFTQVDRNLERAQGGLGIGLSIVKKLAEMHGGTVEARSGGPGLGSEFVVRLPVVVPDAAAGRGAEGPAGPVNGVRRRILVVDDNRDSAESLAMMLTLMGNDTRTAHDGLEAVESAPAFGPDVILMDIGMPRLNGFDTARRIRSEPWGRGVVLVALTGWGQEEDRRRSQEAGFDHHLTKPVDPARLEKLLAELRANTA
ncbi:MAG: PAS domain-containing protein [Gemmataceae bacterium]